MRVLALWVLRQKDVFLDHVRIPLLWVSASFRLGTRKGSFVVFCFI
jgi:hypothetical protein